METPIEHVGLDQDKVQGTLARFTLPPEIDHVETNYGTDHTGDPAVFLTFILKQDVHLEREEIKQVSRFISDVGGALLNAGIGGFPYTRLEEAA